MRTLASVYLFFIAFSSQAQGIEMADQMRSNGKIYVVVAILLAILIGLIIYLVSIDRKVGKLEKKINERNS